jgi:hypothetical protein
MKINDFAIVIIKKIIKYQMVNKKMAINIFYVLAISIIIMMISVFSTIFYGQSNCNSEKNYLSCSCFFGLMISSVVQSSLNILMVSIVLCCKKSILLHCIIANVINYIIALSMLFLSIVVAIEDDQGKGISGIIISLALLFFDSISIGIGKKIYEDFLENHPVEDNEEENRFLVGVNDYKEFGAGKMDLELLNLDKESASITSQTTPQKTQQKTQQTSQTIPRTISQTTSQTIQQKTSQTVKLIDLENPELPNDDGLSNDDKMSSNYTELWSALSSPIAGVISFVNYMRSK